MRLRGFSKLLLSGFSVLAIVSNISFGMGRGHHQRQPNYYERSTGFLSTVLTSFKEDTKIYVATDQPRSFRLLQNTQYIERLVWCSKGCNEIQKAKIFRHENLGLKVDQYETERKSLSEGWFTLEPLGQDKVWIRVFSQAASSVPEPASLVASQSIDLEARFAEGSWKDFDEGRNVKIELTPEAQADYFSILENKYCEFLERSMALQEMPIENTRLVACQIRDVLGTVSLIGNAKQMKYFNRAYSLQADVLSLL